MGGGSLKHRRLDRLNVGHVAELPFLTCCIARLCSAEGKLILAHSVRDDHGMVNRSITVSTYFLVSVVLMSRGSHAPRSLFASHMFSRMGMASSANPQRINMWRRSNGTVRTGVLGDVRGPDLP